MRYWYWLLPILFWSDICLGRAEENTFFRHGVFAPVYGDLGINQGQIAGKTAVLDFVKIGIQVLRFGPVSGTLGYGTVGVQSPYSKTDLPSDFRAHLSGPILEVHYLPEFFLQGSLEVFVGDGTVHYKVDDQKINHKIKATEVTPKITWSFYDRANLFLGLGMRFGNTAGEGDPELEQGDKNEVNILLGFRGSQLFLY